MRHNGRNLQKYAAGIILPGILMLLLSACGGDTPTSAPVPTATTAATAAKTTVASASTTTSATAQAVKTVAPVPKGDRTGVTDTEIRVGGIGPMSGDGAYIGLMLQVMGGYFNMVNDQGGIYGRKIKYIIEDGGFDPAQPLTAAKKLVEQDQVLAISGTLALPFIQTGMRDYFDQKGVPSLPFINNLPEMYEPPHKLQFGMYPPLAPEAKYTVDYAADKLNAKKVAIFYASDAQGVSTYLDGFVSETQAKGLPAAIQIPYKLADTDVSTQLKLLQDSGAEFVYVPDTSAALYALLGAIQTWNNKPKVMINYYNNDMNFYSMMGKAADGVYSSGYILPPDGDDPKSVQYREFMKKYMPNVPVSNYVHGAYVMAQIFVEALRRAGKDLTRETLVAGAESIINWRGSDANSITYGPLNRIAINSYFITQFNNGKIDKVSDWYTIK